MVTVEARDLGAATDGDAWVGRELGRGVVRLSDLHQLSSSRRDFRL
jgi:hypothetical protein